MLKKLAGQTVIYGVSSIVARLLNYLLMPYFTRIFTQAEYGVVTDMYSIIPFALILLTMGMETGYFRFAGQTTDQAEKRRIFATTCNITLISASVFFLLTVIFVEPVSFTMGYGDHINYVLMVGGIIAFDVASAIPFARLREQNRAMTFVALRLLSVIINIALCFFFLYFLPRIASGAYYDPHMGVGYVFLANLIASGVIFVCLWFITKMGERFFDRRLARNMFIYSLPLLISGIMGTANEFIDRQLIKYLLPPDMAMASVGVYGAVVKLAVVMVLFTQMYRYAAEPFFLSGMKEKDFKTSTATANRYFIAVSQLIFLGITLFAELFGLILGRDFREGLYILPIILAAYVFHGITFNLSFWYKQSGKTKYAIWITGAGLAVLIIVAAVLIPILGYEAAAWANLASAATTTVVSYYLNQKHYPVPYNVRAIVTYFLGCGAIYGLSFATDFLPVVPKYICNFALVCVFAAWIVRREKIDIKGLIRSIARR